MAITTLNLRALNRSDTATSGQVITAPSATAADFQDAGGGTWVKILQQTASTSSSLEWKHGTNGCVIDSTYNTYCIRFTDAFCSGVVGTSLQLSSNTGSSYITSGYYTVRLTGNYAGGSSSHTVDDYTDRLININQYGASLPLGGNGEVYIYSPANASSKTQGASYGIECSDGTNNVRHQIGFGVYDTAVAIDAFRIFPSSNCFNSI